jgi:hypothetical protein
MRICDECPERKRGRSRPPRSRSRARRTHAPNQVQLAFEPVLEALARAETGEAGAQQDVEAELAKLRAAAEEARAKEANGGTVGKRGKGHGRRDFDAERAPIETIVLEPPERSLPGGELLIKIGEEVSEHFDYRPASIIRVRVVRPKYRKPTPSRAIRGRPRIFCSPKCRLRAHRAETERASANALRAQAEVRSGADTHEELARAQARVLQLERELASLRRAAAGREQEQHESLQRKNLGAAATKRGAEEFKSLREAHDSAGARLLAEHTVAFERARANAAEASARQAVDAAVKLKRERDDAWEAWRACNPQLAEMENAFKRR